MKESNYEYHVGGSLPINAPSYVTRQADAEFYNSLKLGEFCYVLNSRQMGKSSLRVRTMQKLQSEGFICAFIDLTGIGKEDVTAEKWYAGIVQALVSSCQLSKTINWRIWWRERRDLLSPVQRLSLFIEEILLVEVQQRIFIFVDEIDRVRSQNFCVNDFFSLIRFFYNKRVDNREYQRLTFALLGVATPSDLVADKTQTPFNIGKAIELNGFKLQEVQPLVWGLQGKADSPEKIIQEILNLTGGQPFLTQKICQLVVQYAQNTSIVNAQLVQDIVQTRIIENWEAQDEPEHLKTIRDRILRNENSCGRLLGIYQEILQSSLSAFSLGEIPADGSFEQKELRLSGLVVQQQGKLKVYNWVYQQVFNSKWVEKQLEKLRPYSQNFNAWVNSNFQDESRLLRGQALEDAFIWANNKSLSTLDYRFLAASQDLEKREYQHSLAVTEESSKILANANNILTQAQNKAKKIITFGSLILAVSLVSAIVTMLLLGKASREQAEADVLLTSVYSQKALENSPFEALLQGLKAGYKLQNLKKLFPAKKDTSQQVISTLRQAIYTVRLFNRLEGHRERIKDVSFSPDGKIIASASTDKTIKLWNAQHGILMRSLSDHSAHLSSINFSPHGQILASTGDDGTVKLWNVQFGTLLKTFKAHNERLSSVSFSPDAKILAVAAMNGKVALVNVDGGKILQIIDAHSEPVLSVSFSPDGKIIASASFDRTLKLWNVSNGSLITTLKGHQDKLASASFSPNGKMLATASFDRTLKLWNVSNGSLVYTFEGHLAPVKSVSFSPNGRAIASASEDGSVKVWDLEQKEIEPQTFKGDRGHLWDVSFSPDGKTLATAGDDSTIGLWKIDSMEPQTLALHSGRVWSVNFSPDGKILASASADRTIQLWNIEKSRLQTLKGHTSDIRSVSFNPNGDILASASDDGTVKLWILKDGTLLKTLKGHSDRLSRVIFNPDGKTLVSAGDDEVFKLWNVFDSTLLQTFKAYDNRRTGGRLTGISFSPDGKILAYATDEEEIHFRSVGDGMHVKTLKGHSNQITSINFSNDGKFLASGSADNTVKLWRLEDYSAVKTLKAHNNWITSINFSPKGTTFASGSLDSKINIWDINEPNPVQTLKSHRHWVTSVSFSPNGKTLASAGSDGTVKLWNTALDLEDLMQLGCTWG